LNEKIGELWSTNTKVRPIGTQVDFFGETTFQPLGGAGPSNFYTR